MARQIVVERDGKPTAFGFSKVDRMKLYGARRRIPLDPEGNRCTRASLTEDGSVLLRPGMTAQGYFSDEGEWLPNKQLVGLNDSGEIVDKIPSTLGVAQALEGPLPPEQLLDASIGTVYALEAEDLEAEEVDAALLKELQEGKLFRFAFNYRPDYRGGHAFLVANPEGELFALVCQMTEPVWRDAEETIAVDTGDDDDDAGDLDFEMF